MRRQQPTALVPPAQQRLVPNHHPILQAHDRLVVGQEIAALDRPAQVRLQVQAEHGLFAHGLVEDRVAIAAFALGPVHGRIGVAQQLLAALVARMPQGDAHAGRRIELTPGHPQRPAQQGQQARCQVAHAAAAVLAGDQDREFVAAQARDHVVGAHRRHQPLGHFHQQAVAGGMAHAVVDQLEPVQVQEQHRERHAVAQARTLDRMTQAVEQVGPVGQAGQVVVQGLVGQALLGTQAFADLRQQLLVGLFQLDGARDHALFQFGVGRAQPLLGALPGQAIADVVGHEGEQALVVHAEPDRRVVALHHHHAHHLLFPVQRHAQPAAGLVAVLVGLAGRNQVLDHGAIGQQGLAGLQDVLGQAVAEPARWTLAAGFVHRIDELDRLPVLAEHGDVEVARIDQLVHRRMHLGVVLLQGFGAHRHLGDPEQRMLQAFGALALQHLLLQLTVGLLQLQGALAHPAFQLGLGLAPVQGGQHVLGHVAQQRPVLIAVTAGTVVALDHDRATDAVAALHRHTQPVHRLGPLEVGARHLQQLPDRSRRTTQGLAVAQQTEGQAVGQFALGPLLLLGRHIGVDLVGEIDETHRTQVLVTGDQVTVGRVHQ